MRRIRKGFAVISLLVQAAAAPAVAQTPASSLAGARVRVTVAGGPAGAPTGDPAANAPAVRAAAGAPTRVLVGRIARIDERVLILSDASGPPTEILLSDVQNLELSVGEHRNAGRGALIGGGVGMLVGAVAGAIEGGQCEGDWFCPGAGGGAALGAIGLGGIGAAVGLGIGALVKTERWSEVSSRRWGLTVQPGRGAARGGVELGVRVGL